ncbi:MAG: trypsin-like peptidase domain-containing protein [Solirubrobacteraceae bacterium]|jgi:S1-C subfamily serine protease
MSIPEREFVASPLRGKAAMSGRRTRIAVAACRFVAAALFVVVIAGPSPRLEGSEPPASSAEAKTSLPDLVAGVARAIARVEVWRPCQVKDAKTGKVIPGLHWAGETGTGFVVRCQRVGGSDTIDDVEFDVVTNNHVLVITQQCDWTGPSNLMCTVYGLATKSATVLGTDVAADLAVIRARAQAPKGEMPKTLAWADAKSMRVGDDVVAIGYARDLRGSPTVTRGIISALRRTEPTTGIDSAQALFADLIQSDASSNHGNSGGPLLNMRGEVLGVNTYQIPPAVTKDAKDNVSVDVTYGIFFARSSRTAKPFVDEIIRSGKVARPNLGCTMVTLIVGRFLGWPPCVRLRTGAGVPATSLAAKAGLRGGDVIIAVGSASQRPAAPDPSQETKIGSVGELNDALGLCGGAGCIWVRFIRPPAAVVTAMGAGQQVPYPGGNSQVAFLR